MRVPLGDLAQFGVNKDMQDYNLPPTAWTDARNVRFQDGKLVRATGHDETLDSFPDPAPIWAMHVLSAFGESHWMVATAGAVFDFSSNVWTDISKSAVTYTADPDRLWNGGQLGNIPIINNGSEVPQMWSPVSAIQLLVDLPNWPANLRAAVVKPFKTFLFALNLSIAGDPFPHRIRISHPAVPGGVPSSWDPTDATKDVYENEVADVDTGFLVDCEPMRDFNVIYKERSTHGAQFIGGRDKWRIFPIFSQVGLFQPHCVCAFADNSQHFLMTGDDLIIHNGQSPQKLLPERLRRWLIANIDPIAYPSCFVVHNQQETECWACIPLIGSTWPNLALVWNYQKNTLTFRELDQFSFITPGRIPLIEIDPWDGDAEAWDSDESRWETFTHPPFIPRLLAVKPTAQKLFHMDYTDAVDGVNYEASVERFGFDIIALSKGGEIIRDREAMRFVKRAYFQAKGSPFFVQLGMQQEIEGPITWSAPELFTPGMDKFVDFEDAKATQLFGLRVFSTSAGSWEIAGIDIDVEPLGEF